MADWLNYHHLFYFWTVATEGSITAAAHKLRLGHPAVSTQVRQLEASLGGKLFDRKGRQLVLTDTGRMAFRYAEEIFALGRELTETMARGTSGQQRLVVGLSDALAKSIVHRILEPVFRLPESVRVVCREDRSMASLLVELAAHEVDVVLSDTPAGPGSSVRAFNHLLGECGSTFFASASLLRARRGRFPGCLDGMPLLLPARGSTFRRAIDAWLDEHALRPEIVAELDDAALAKDFGAAGVGAFVVPDVLEAETRRRYGVAIVGRASDVRQRFYAISVERKVRHPAVVAICETARTELFD